VWSERDNQLHHRCNYKWVISFKINKHIKKTENGENIIKKLSKKRKVKKSNVILNRIMIP
jgi:hypothetical protein